MGSTLWIMLACAVFAGSFIFLLAAVLLGGSKATGARGMQPAEGGPTRRRSISGLELETPKGVFPKVGMLIMPKDDAKQNRLRTRLQQAGLYRRHNMVMFMTLKFLLMVGPMALGFLLSLTGSVGLSVGVLVGAFVGLVGNLAPSIWLNSLRTGRQRNIRRALPDALDIIVVCMEGGLSLPGALDRVSLELNQAHPLLAEELGIVRREIQLGRSTGEALRQFADRFDLDELRSLSSVVKQAERYGASIGKALKVHSETLRLKRYQHAEAMAQKAPVKLIFPTVLCIFPALYIVLMGPAGVHLLKLLDNIAQ